MGNVKVATVGCGGVAQLRHIPSFLKLGSRISLVALCDVNLGRAGEAARKFGNPNIYPDLSSLISKERPDIVDICTPPESHLELAIAAMERGCHVLIEKPMALKSSDCEQMM